MLDNFFNFGMVIGLVVCTACAIGIYLIVAYAIAENFIRNIRRSRNVLTKILLAASLVIIVACIMIGLVVTTIGILLGVFMA